MRSPLGIQVRAQNNWPVRTWLGDVARAAPPFLLGKPHDRLAILVHNPSELAVESSQVDISLRRSPVQFDSQVCTRREGICTGPGLLIIP